MVSYIVALLTGLCLLGFDQYTKALIIKNFHLSESKPFINGFIDLVYVQNTGGAWGLLSGQTVILLLITIIIMIFCVVVLVRYAKNNKLLFWSVVLVLFGGIGNMIDRIFRDGIVIDFLHFEFWPQFPVFNIADCGIVIGAGLLILYFLIDIKNDYKQKKLNSDENSENDDNN